MFYCFLLAGTHEYPFSYELPKDLPETMDGSRYATLTYTIKASVYMTLGRVSHSIEDTFYLKALPDTRMPKLENDDLPKVRFTKYVIISRNLSFSVFWFRKTVRMPQLGVGAGSNPHMWNFTWLWTKVSTNWEIPSKCM